MMLASKNIMEFDSLKERLKSEFEMKMGQASKILGIDIKRDRYGGKLFLTQETFIDKFLEKFNMTESKPLSTPSAQHQNFCRTITQDRGGKRIHEKSPIWKMC